MQYLMSGFTEIDIDDWRKNTVYKEYKETNDVIIWFWKVSSAKLQNLIFHYFVLTGS